MSNSLQASLVKFNIIVFSKFLPVVLLTPYAINHSKEDYEDGRIQKFQRLRLR